MGRLKSLVLFCVLGACAIPGSQEFEVYSAAFQNADRATDEVLLVYNDIEKATRRTGVDARIFDPDFAYLYVPERLAPLSTKIDKGFELIGIYNSVLARYASGNTLSLFDSEFVTISESVDAVARAAGSSDGLPGFDALLTATRTVLNLALARADRKSFAEAVRAEKGKVDGFLAEVRDQTEDMFEDARAEARRQAGKLRNLSDAAQIFEKRDEFKVMLATWVLAIDDTRSLLKDLATAVETGGSSAASIAQAAATSDRIAGYANQIAAARQQISEAF